MPTMMSYGFGMVTVDGKAFRYTGVIFACIAMFISSTHLPFEYLPIDKTKMEQFGGGGSLEEQCGSITFEDIFIYNQAIFEVRVNDDWQTAEVDARAWINWSLADDIRSDLDAFLEGIVPSGGDGWLSSDEIEAMVSIAADCLEYSITRIGIRDGSPHRGGVGVDWMNTSWESDQTTIGHFNGVPERHSEIRDCQGFSQEGCFEVPVVPSSTRDCDVGIDQSAGADECRIELWLNATMVIGGVSDPNDFTVAFNSSNMSNARLDFTFPVMPELRMNMWEECEGRFVGPDEDNPQTDAAPIRGSCIGDGSASYDLRTNDDGSLTYRIDSNFSRENWPMGEDVFADFTTSPVPTNEPPEWTVNAPVNGSWFPVFEDGPNKLSTWEEISSWFDDESGVASLEISCTSGQTELSQSIDGSLWINVDGITHVTCQALDSSGKTSGNRTWIIGVPVSISTASLLLDGEHPLTITRSESWEPETTVRLALSQDGQLRQAIEYIGQSTGTHEVLMPSQGIVPGPVQIWVEVVAGERSFERTFDLGIVKESEPPLLTLGMATFDGWMWKVEGHYSDPDGELVTFTIEIADTVHQVEVMGNTWETEWVDLTPLALGGGYDQMIIDVEITGCDQSGKCTTIQTSIDTSMIEIPEVTGPSEGGASETSLPATGIPALLIAFSIAILFRRRY
tara:strand:+ start:1212 stop:3248 length:2037 start_codon:yes stop_codon:yes gene_type:complete